MVSNKKTPIKDFYNVIMGYIEVDPATGDEIATDFYGKILGYYDKKLNITRDFYKKILARGNVLSGLIYNNYNKKNKGNKKENK